MIERECPKCGEGKQIGICCQCGTEIPKVKFFSKSTDEKVAD